MDETRNRLVKNIDYIVHVAVAGFILMAILTCIGLVLGMFLRSLKGC